MVEFIETTTFSVAVISTGSMTTAIYTFGTSPLRGEIFFIINKMFHVKQN